jgi:hypothetical protein
MLPNLVFIVRCLPVLFLDIYDLLSEHFNVYFPLNDDQMNFNEQVRNQLHKNMIMGAILTPIQEDKLLELSYDRGLEAAFQNETSLSAFWIKIRSEYVEVILPGKFCYRSHLLTSLKQDFRR